MAFPIRIIAFGKARVDFQDHIDRYITLTRPFGFLKLEMLKPPGGKKLDPLSVRRATGEQMMARWPKRCYPVALSEEGKTMTSQKFANWLGKRMQEGTEVIFNIGAAHGLDEQVKRQSREVMSLSSMTFSHSLSLLVLTEQIYRAFTILNNHPYHKSA